MRDARKTKKALIQELNELRRLVADSEAGMFQALLDGLSAVGVGVDIVGTDYRVKFQNSVLTERFGDRAGELCYRAYVGREEPCDPCPMTAALGSGQIERADVTGVDGRLYAVMSASLPAGSGHGESAIEVILDVTERKRAEEELRRSEQQIKEFAEMLPQVACEMDPDGNVAFANKNAFRAFGYAEEDLQAGLNVLDMVAPEDRARARENVQRVLAGQGGARPNEYTMLRRDGSTFPGLVYGSPIMRDGQAVGLRCIVVDITERMRAEEALRESEKFSSGLLESAPHPITVINLDTSVEYVNPALEKLTGFSFEEVVGRKAPYPWWPGGTREQMTRDLDRVLQEGAVRLEETFQKRNGERFWVEITSMSVAGDDGPKYFLGNWVDITERKAAEEALRESENRFRNLFEQSPDGYFVHDFEGNLLDVNQAFLDIFGYTRREALALRFSDTHPPTEEAQEAGRRAFREVTTTGSTRFETDFIRKSGEVFPAEASSRIVEVAGEKLVQGIVRDITARKRAQEALKRSEAQLSNALQIARASHWEYDVDRDVFTFNDNFYGIFRTTAAEMGGYEMSSADYARRFCHPDDAATVGEETRLALETADPNFSRQLEHRILYADGEVGYITVRFFIVKDSEGRTVKTYGVNQDITERRSLEEQLRQAQKMEAVGRLAGGVAHDLNNLLTGIRGCGEFALEEAEPASQAHQDLTEVLALTDRAADLTGQLLAFSRRQPLQPIVFEVNSLIADSVKMLTRLLREDVDLQFIPAEDAGNVRADPNHIEQVVMNLAVNARDAMPDGGRLSIETANVELGDDYARSHAGVIPGHYVMVALSDTGCGMDAETREHIFDPFFTTKERGRGTGLGLSTAYGIVKQHGGHLWVYSELGKGTTFKVYLPCVAEPVEERAPKSAFISGGTETILLVEDDDAVRDVGRRHLEALGYTVLCAADAHEAEAAAEEHGEAVDLLLTDVVMPDRNGRELHEALAARRPGLKVLYMSGYTDNAIVHHGVLQEGLPFLQKPFERNSLADMVRQALDR